MTRLSLVVYGLPAPQGSKRHVGNGVMVESSKRVRPWREDVKQAALTALEQNPDWDPAARFVTGHIVFTLPRPRSHFRTGRNAALLRTDAPYLVGVKPDLDKLLRSTLDALDAAGVFADDSRVAQVFTAKTYPHTMQPGALDRPGCSIDLAQEERPHA